MDGHLWVGVFESMERFQAYRKEHYFEDERPVPLSEFAADQGEEWYDHDWFEFHHVRDASDSAAVIGRTPLQDDAKSEALTAAAAAGLSGVNTAIFCSAEDGLSVIRDPRDCSGPGYELCYLGRFRWQ